MTKDIAVEQGGISLNDCKDVSEAAALLSGLTVVQLRSLAKERKVILPRTVKRKADIIAKLIRELFPTQSPAATQKTSRDVCRSWREFIIQSHISRLIMAWLWPSPKYPALPARKNRERLMPCVVYSMGLRQPRYLCVLPQNRPP